MNPCWKQQLQTSSFYKQRCHKFGDSAKWNGLLNLHLQMVASVGFLWALLPSSLFPGSSSEESVAYLTSFNKLASECGFPSLQAKTLMDTEFSNKSDYWHETSKRSLFGCPKDNVNLACLKLTPHLPSHNSYHLVAQTKDSEASLTSFFYNMQSFKNSRQCYLQVMPSIQPPLTIFTLSGRGSSPGLPPCKLGSLFLLLASQPLVKWPVTPLLKALCVRMIISTSCCAWSGPHTCLTASLPLSS